MVEVVVVVVAVLVVVVVGGGCGMAGEQSKGGRGAVCYQMSSMATAQDARRHRDAAQRRCSSGHNERGEGEGAVRERLRSGEGRGS